MNVVGNKWVFKMKRKEDGSIQRYKAKLVAKGFHQRAGIDYTATFKSIIKPSTIRIVLALAVSNGWPIRQIDVNNVFLNDMLKEEVFMVQPKGYHDKDKLNHVCRLNRSLNGLKQAPRPWYDKLRHTLTTWGLTRSRMKTSLFTIKTIAGSILVLPYVDEIIVTVTPRSIINALVLQLDRHFSLKDLGPVSFFFGY